MKKSVQLVLMGVTIVASFAAGNYVMKLIKSNSQEAKQAASMVSQYRPGFVLPDIAGNMRDLNEWNGKVVVVNFWATWCPPCKREMPDFVELQEQYGAQGLQFIGIALDEADKVENFVDTLGVEYPILLGGDKALKTSSDYGNSYGALPYTAVVGRDGAIVSTYRGEVLRKDIEADIKSAL